MELMAAQLEVRDVMEVMGGVSGMLEVEMMDGDGVVGGRTEDDKSQVLAETEPHTDQIHVGAKTLNFDSYEEKMNELLTNKVNNTFLLWFLVL